MKNRRAGARGTTCLAVVAALFLQTILVLVAPAVGASAATSSPFPLLVDPPDTFTPLPAGYGGDTVVDPVRGLVFMSRGVPFNSVVVTDLDGDVVKLLTGLPRPLGMALGADGKTMFVALADGDAVAAIDLATLTERRRIGTGAGSCPQWLASAAGKLWVSYGCSGHTGSVAQLDTTLDSQPLPDFPDSRYLDPMKLKLASASPSSPVLAVAWGWWNGSLVDVFDVSGATPRVMASRSRPEGLVEPFDVAVSPDAGTVFVAGIKTGGQLARYGALAFASSDLSDRGFYETAPYISSVGASPDGRHIVTTASASEEPDVQVFAVGTFTPTHMRWHAGANVGSAAWGPDGTTVYAPDGLVDGRSALRMIHGLGVDPGQVEVAAPSGLLAKDAQATVSGRLRTTDGTPTAGLAIKVTRSGPDGTRDLPALTTGPDGRFSLTDVPSSAGGFTYRFTWPGDAAHAPATASGSVRVEGTPPVPALPAPLAAAGADHDLDLAKFGTLVVDELHQRLLISGRESGTVAVLDLSGARLGTISGLAGANGMALSRDGTTLYVALAGASAIAAIDTDRLVEVGRWSTLPKGIVPVEVGVAGGQVFFSYYWRSSSRSGWGSFRESAPASVPTWDHLLGPLNAAGFVTSPTDPSFLIAGVPTGTAFRMDASTTPPTILARSQEYFEYGSRLSPDGKQVLQRGSRVLDATTLAQVDAPRYDSGTGVPYSGAYTADGQFVAAAVESQWKTVVEIWPRAGGNPARSLVFDGVPPFKGLAFTSDSSRLYAITTAPPGNESKPVLHVVNRPLAGMAYDTPGDSYHPVTPGRLLDTRIAFGAATTAPVGPASTISLQVTGRGGVPATGVSAVTVNLTAVEPTAGGHLTAWPADGGPRPLASNINLHPGLTVANLAVVKVGPGGAINIYNAAGWTHIVVDIAGWYGNDGAGARYTAVTPARLVDGRLSAPWGRLTTGSTFGLDVRGYGGVPRLGVSAVVLNVTAVAPSAGGYLTVFPAGATRPLASNLNFTAGQTVPNLVVVKVDATGHINFFNFAGNVDLVVDVAGWYGVEGSRSASAYNGLPPSRIVDTRFGNGAPTQPMGPDSTLSVQVTGRGGVPATGVAAVALNVTAVEPTAGGFLTAWPAGVPRPLASNLNMTPYRTVANMVFVKVGTDGKVNIYNAVGRTDIVVDVAGWYAG